MKYLAVIVTILTAISFGGCRPRASAATPPVMRLGEDACDECRMAIDDLRFAAARVQADGQALRFDDIGDMLLHGADPTGPGIATWVWDYHTQQPLDAEAAWFVRGDSLQTPMGHGIAAFAERPAAAALAAEIDGVTLTYSELIALFTTNEAPK